MSLRKSPYVLLTVSRGSLPRPCLLFHVFRYPKTKLFQNAKQFFLYYACSNAHAGQRKVFMIIMVIARQSGRIGNNKGPNSNSSSLDLDLYYFLKVLRTL